MRTTRMPPHVSPQHFFGKESAARPRVLVDRGHDIVCGGVGRRANERRRDGNVGRRGIGVGRAGAVRLVSEFDVADVLAVERDVRLQQHRRDSRT